jgi:hypothetical protein
MITLKDVMLKIAASFKDKLNSQVEFIAKDKPSALISFCYSPSKGYLETQRNIPSRIV